MAVTKVTVDGLDYSLQQQNIIHNGNHIIDQRNRDDTAVTNIDDGSGVFISDRWQVVANGSASARWTGSIQTSNGPSGNDRWLKMLCTTADASPGSAEMAWVRQGVEASNCQPLVDTSNGKIGAFTVSGQLIAYSASSFPLKVALVAWTDDGTQRQYVSDISVAASATWQAFSVTIPADATGSFANDTGSGIRIGFALYGGSGRQATNNTWANYDGDCVTSATHNWAAATNEYIGFTDFKVEPGSFATGFVREDYETALAKCQRYYERLTFDSSANQEIGTGMCSQTTTFSTGVTYKVRKRATPTVTPTAAATFEARHQITTTVCSGVSGSTPGVDRTGLSCSVSSGLTAGQAVVFRRNDSDTAYIEVSAEL